MLFSESAPGGTTEAETLVKAALPLVRRDENECLWMAWQRQGPEKNVQETLKDYEASLKVRAQVPGCCRQNWVVPKSTAIAFAEKVCYFLQAVVEV